MHRRNLRRILGLLVLGLALGAACNNPKAPQIEIIAPLNGLFGAPGAVEGKIHGIAVANARVEINGIPTGVSPNKEFALPWAALVFPPDAVFHTVSAELFDATGKLLARDFVAIHNVSEYVAGPHAKDAPLQEALQGRLNIFGFEDLTEIVRTLLIEELTRQLAMAPETLFVAGALELDVAFPTPICVGISDFATGSVLPGMEAIADLLGPASVLFGLPGDLCVDRFSADLDFTELAQEFGDDPRSLVELDLAPGNALIGATLTLPRLVGDFSASLDGYVSFLTLPGGKTFGELADIELGVCSLHAEVTDLEGTLPVAIEPAADPHFVEADVVDDLDLDVGDVDLDFGGVACALPGLGLDALLNGPTLDLLVLVAETLLNQVDPEDDETIVSRVVEASVQDLEIEPQMVTDPVTGDRLQVDATLAAIDEDSSGATVEIDTSITPTRIDPLAAGQDVSFLASGVPPAPDIQTPLGADYDLAVSISTGVMNQALRAASDLGSFSHVVSEAEIDFTALGICLPDPTAPPGTCLAGPQDLYAVLTALGVPANLLPSNPLELRLRPTLPPVVAMPDGPTDPHWLHVHVGHYLVEIVEPIGGGADEVWFQIALGAKAPITFTAGTTPGTIVAAVGSEFAGGVVIEKLGRSWPSTSAVSAVASGLYTTYVQPQLSIVLSEFPVPAIDDPSIAPDSAFDVVPLEAGLTYNWVTLFATLEAVE